MEKVDGGENEAGDEDPASPKLAPLGYVHYTFCWYNLGELPSDEGRGGAAVASSSDPTSSLYGVASTTAAIRPPKVSELVFCMDEIQCTANGFASLDPEKNEKKNTNGQSEENTKDAGVTSTDEKVPSTSSQVVPSEIGCEVIAIILAALALEHVRGNDIWYGILDVPTFSEMKLLKKYFRMSSRSRGATTAEIKPSSYPMACDMKRCSFRFAFLRYLEENRGSGGTSTIDVSGGDPTRNSCGLPLRERMLVRLPDAEVVAACQKSLATRTPAPTAVTMTATPTSASVGTGTNIQLGTSDTPLARAISNEHASQAPAAPIDNAPFPVDTGIAASSAPSVSKQILAPPKKAELYFTSANENARSKAVGVRIGLHPVPTGPPQVQLLSMPPDASARGSLVAAEANSIAAQSFEKTPEWQVLKTFALPNSPSESSNATKPSSDKSINEASTYSKTLGNDGTILSDLLRKQEELRKLEGGMEPKLRQLFTKAYQERLVYEAKEQVEERNKTKATVSEYEAVIARRREADAAWQAQLEQDMDAVCDICLDGDVTVDNQILFCEACNVAVHQKCYGIPRIPEGDYFCKACRHFGRDRVAAEQASRLAMSGGAKRPRHQPLPICCEACPRKQGAFLRTMEEGQEDGPSGGPAKWIHVTCAKWMGLRYVDAEKQDAVESVQGLKADFRDNYHRCCLCESERGCFNKCNEPGCDRWAHVTCARSSGLCRVIHGENSLGSIESEVRWKLWCPEHSGILPEDIPTGSLSLDQLKASASAFPPEPRRPPPPASFDKLARMERAKFWDDRRREKEMVELLMQRVEGARCAVCNVIDPNENNKLAMCSSCGVVVHRHCYMGQAPRGEKEFFCQACKYVSEEQGKDKYEVPQCHMCNMSGGVLRKATATPTSMKRFKSQMKKFEQTLFGKQIWCHTICAM